MFETYLQDHRADPRLRQRRTIAALAAACSITLGLSAFLVGQKLGISSVSAPHVDHVVVTQTSVQPPPSAKVPDRPQSTPPKGGGPKTPAVARDQAPDDEPTPEVPMEPAGGGDDALGKTPDGRTGIGNPFGNPTAPRCLDPLCAAGKEHRRIVPPTAPPKEPEQKKPLAWMKARALFAPDPDTALLARTPTGRTTRKSGEAAVSFCVDKRGKVVHAKISKSFGDSEVDRICRQTVTRWRFKPSVLDGTAKRSCSTARFQILFESSP